jgi:hypothetical protein
MKSSRLFKILLISIVASYTCVFRAIAQNTQGVTNNNNDNVQVNELGEGSQQQGQSADGGSSEVTVTDEDSSDNFWTSGYYGRLIIPPGSASLTCGEQTISFSRSEGFGLGVGAAGVNFSDNVGEIPEEFKSSLLSIQQCLREKNISGILEQYLKLAKDDRAVADTYLRTVSPEVYATFFVQNAKEKGEILSEQSYANLATNLRSENFDQVVEWQDHFDSAALAKDRVLLDKNRELRSLEREKRLAELEVLELERRAKEVEAIFKYKQSQLDNFLDQYQQ